MTYVLFLIAFLLGLIRKNSKPVFLFQLLVIFLFFAGSANNADYTIYQYRFNNYVLLANETEPLFTLLIQFCHILGMNYRGFLVLVSFIYTLTLGFFSHRYARSPCFALSLYLIFPACLDVVQVRFTVSCIFVILGFYALLNQKSKHRFLQFSFLIAIATLFHYSSIFFWLLGFLSLFDKRKIIIWVIAFSFFIFFIWPSMASLLTNIPIIGSKLQILSTFVSIEYKTKDLLRSLVWYLVFFISFQFNIYYDRKKLKTTTFFLNKVISFNYASLIIIPLLFLSVDFYRLELPLIFFNYCAISGFFPDKNKNTSLFEIKFSKKKFLSKMLAIISSICNLYVIILRSPNLYSVFEPYFSKNIFLL